MTMLWSRWAVIGYSLLPESRRTNFFMVRVDVNRATVLWEHPNPIDCWLRAKVPRWQQQTGRQRNKETQIEIGTQDCAVVRNAGANDYEDAKCAKGSQDPSLAEAPSAQLRLRARLAGHQE